MAAVYPTVIRRRPQGAHSNSMEASINGIQQTHYVHFVNCEAQLHNASDVGRNARFERWIIMSGAKKKLCDCITGAGFTLGSVSCSIKGSILNIKYSAYSCDSDFSDDMVILNCMWCGRKLNAPQNTIVQTEYREKEIK